MTTPARDDSAASLIAPFLAVVSIVGSLLALAYEPIKIIPFAVLLALIATAMGRRGERLPFVAVLVGAACFVIAMTIAVLTRHALY